MSCRSFSRASALIAIVAILTGAPARANPYESFLDVETEQDLYDALSVRQISSDTFERLLDLLARGVDLEVASRQELYELPNLTYGEVDAILAYRGARAGRGGRGVMGDGSALVAAGVLEEQRYLAIAPFLLARSSAPGWSGVRGLAQLQARSSLEERGLPPLGARVRAAGFGGLTTGIAAVVTRQRLDDVRYDPNRGALLAGDPEPRVEVPKAYLRWEDDRHAVLLGSYRAGFGQRLVFDNTGAEQPAGFAIDDQLVSGGGATRACKLAAGELPSPCAGEETARASPDVRWREALFGAAAAARRLALGPGWLALHAWGSYSERAVYQYELVDRGRCADPRRDGELACAAPAVLRRPDGELLAPAARHAYQTLPAMFAEALAGGNATYWLDRRTRAGVTAYAARADDLVGGVALGTQEGSRWPGGQRFGAAGAEVAVGRGGLELGAEVARSFDELPRAAGLSAGGGLGAVLRVALSRQREEVRGAGGAPIGGGGTELELTARYYQATFVNPYARPVAAADEREGQRARDEAGVRARASSSWPRGAVRATVDGWVTPSTGTPRLSSDLRVEHQAGPRLRWGASLAFQDKDLAHGGRDECFEGSSAGEESDGIADVEDARRGDGGSRPCRGMKLSSSGRVATAFSPGLDLTAQAQHELLDDGGAREQRLALWLIGRWRSLSGARVRAQLRYRGEALGHGGPRAFAGAVEVRLGFGAASRISLRLDGQLELPRAAASSAPSCFLALGVSYDVEL